MLSKILFIALMLASESMSGPLKGNKLLIIVILDESYSMSRIMSETTIGFNGFMADAKKITNGPTRLILVKFNTESTVVYKGIDLDLVPPLSHYNYFPNGWTALFDSIVTTLSLANSTKNEDERVYCAILTDGEENSSKMYKQEDVKQSITGYIAKGWNFTYVGPNAKEWAKEMGLPTDCFYEFNHLEPKSNFEKLSLSLEAFF